MKAKDLRNMTEAELNQRMEELYRKLLKLRSDIKIGRLENPHQIRASRREIARIKTILNERRKAKSEVGE